MTVLTFSFADGLGQVSANGDVIVDRPFNVAGGVSMLWHIDPLQAQDLFDTSGVNYGGKAPFGWGFWTPDNTLVMCLGKEQQSFAWFAYLYNVLTVDPENDEEVSFVSGSSGAGWLFRGRRVPSGQVGWSVT